VLSTWFRRIRHRLLTGIIVPVPSIAEIREAIGRNGRWERHDEWRISTVTSSLIERTAEAGYRKYLVRVECDYVFEARCPTLSRAIEIVHVYESLIPRLWQEHGWPSWASRSQLEAGDDERSSR
jgi:hypothetical protein